VQQRVILRLLSLFESASTASPQHLYKSSASRWTASKVVHGYDLHRLNAFSYHGCRLQSESDALLSVGLQCGTVCHPHCTTTICHWTPNYSSARTMTNIINPAPRCGVFCDFWRRDTRVLTYLLTDLLTYLTYLLETEFSVITHPSCTAPAELWSTRRPLAVHQILQISDRRSSESRSSLLHLQ